MKLPIHVVGLAELVPETEGEALAILRALAEETRREPGCLRYDVYRDLGNPLRLNLIGVFVDHAAIRRHGEARHTTSSLAALKDKVIGTMELRVLGPLDDEPGV